MASQRMPNSGISLDGGSADIHLKMCKKVAQLTKVIYVLNTRLDENDSIVGQLKSDHEKELEQIRNETAEKLRMYKSVVEQLSVSERKAAELDECLQLQKRQEVEALTRFESFKQESNERERTLRGDYSARLLELGAEVLKIKHLLEEKMSQLDKLASERSVDKDKLNSAEELERRYKDEITSMRDRNQQLQTSVDKLKGDYNSLLQKAQSEFNSKESEMKETISKLEKELADAMMTSMNQLQSTQTELGEKHNQEISSLKAEIEKMKKHSTVQEEQHQIRVNELVQRLATSDALAEELRAEINRKTDILKNQTSDSDVLSKQLMDISAKNNNLLEETSRLERELTKLNKKCSELSRDVLRKSEELSSTESSRLQLESLSNDLRRELESTKKALATAETRLTDTSNSSSEAEARMKARVSDLESENAQVRRENAKLLAENSNQKLLLTEEFTRKKNELIATHENQILVLRSQHEEELTRERLSGEERLGKLSKDLLGATDQLRSQYESEKALLVKNYETEIENLRKELADKLAALNQLEETSKTQSQEILNLRRQQEATSGEAKDALWNLSEIKRKLSRLEEHNKKIEDENADMKTRHPVELHRLEAEYKQNMESAVAKVEAEWSAKLRSEVTAIRKTMLGESEQKYQSSIDELQREKEAELQAVKDGWQKKTSDLLKELSEARQKLSAAEQQLAAETARLRSDYDAQLASLREEMQYQNNQLNEQIRLLKSETEEESAYLMAEKEKAIKEAEERFKSEYLEAMQAQAVAHKAVSESMARQHEMEKTRALEEAARQHSLELAEVRDSLAKKHLAEMEQAVRFHDAQASAVRQELEKVVELTRKQERDYEARLEEMRRQMKQRDQRVSTLEENVSTWEQKANALVSQLETARHEATRARDQIMAEMRVREEEAIANAEREMEQAKRDARFQQQAMVDDFTKAQQLLKEKISSLQLTYSELDERFRARESRDEDLALIEELKDRLRIKATELNQVLHEKRSLEMELVNRERNFNKIFSNNPQVGVVDPISSMKAAKRPSADLGAKNAARTHSGGSDVSSVNGNSAQFRSTKGHRNGSIPQAWGSTNLGASQQKFLDPLPHSPPIRDDPINPLKPLPPAPKISTKI